MRDYARLNKRDKAHSERKYPSQLGEEHRLRYNAFHRDLRANRKIRKRYNIPKIEGLSDQQIEDLVKLDKLIMRNILDVQHLWEDRGVKLVWTKLDKFIIHTHFLVNAPIFCYQAVRTCGSALPAEDVVDTCMFCRIPKCDKVGTTCKMIVIRRYKLQIIYRWMQPGRNLERTT